MGGGKTACVCRNVDYGKVPNLRYYGKKNPRPGRIDYNIHVRISRIWEFRGANEEKDLKHLDLEGKLVIMSKITVDNPYMIKINKRTCIFSTNAENINFPKYTYRKPQPGGRTSQGTDSGVRSASVHGGGRGLDRDPFSTPN
ncbi:hypothetical protein U9M48_008026 [Paspalum notatum var. saurae]|uniref:Uncharacterized protein n=1 Tax=Paspalum notatum var. saurae TaxID=547442 RepID=A0AAQ3SN65_PASNO